jgi:hypothetical protein
MPNTVRLHCVLATKPDKVYRAFIEADAMAKWLPSNGFACTVHHLDAKVGGSFRMSFRNFTTGKSHSARRAPALHGQIRRSQSAGRNPGDGGAQASVLRHRAEYRAGRSSRRHSGGSVLSWLARNYQCALCHQKVRMIYAARLALFESHAHLALPKSN